MIIYPLILLGLIPPQEKPKPDTPEDRAKRAAIVDRIMGQPAFPELKLRRMIVPEVQEPAFEQQPDDFARKRAARLAAIRVQAPMQVHVGDGGRQMLLTIEQPVLEKADGEVDRPEPVMQMGFNLRTAVLEPQNFDRWIFGDGVNEEGRRLRLQSRLSEKIDRVMKDHKINLAQLQKLRLAGSGDIKRYLDRVEQRRPDFEVARMTFNTGWNMLREMRPLSEEFQEGPFGGDSLFARTLKKIEDDSAALKKEGIRRID